jgi:hypothetical protein
VFLFISGSREPQKKLFIFSQLHIVTFRVVMPVTISEYKQYLFRLYSHCIYLYILQNKHHKETRSELRCSGYVVLSPLVACVLLLLNDTNNIWTLVCINKYNGSMTYHQVCNKRNTTEHLSSTRVFCGFRVVYFFPITYRHIPCCNARYDFRV